MSELISGKDALIVLANGQEVECRAYEKNWINANNKHHTLSLFFDDSFQFRLKPRTITINGIEVPECGKDYKYGNAMYILNSLEIGEYCMVVLDKADEVPAYWWTTESEIKQVVAALREAFK